MFLPILALFGLVVVSAVAGTLATSPSARGKVAGVLGAYGDSPPRTKVVTTNTTARGKGRRAVQRTRTVTKPRGRVTRAAAKAASTWFEPPADGKNDPDKPIKKVPTPRPSGSATPQKGSPVSTPTTTKPAGAKPTSSKVPRSRAKATTSTTSSKGSTTGRGSGMGSAKESLPALHKYLQEAPKRLEDAELKKMLAELETITDLDGFDPGQDIRSALEDVATQAKAAHDLLARVYTALEHAEKEVSSVHARAQEMPGDAEGDLTKFTRE